MAVASARSSLIADKVRRKTELSATRPAELASTESVPFAGNIALTVSVMMALSASSLRPTVAELATLSGARALATTTTKMSVAARNGVPSGTPSARLTSTTLLAAFAHLTVPLVRPTLAFLALRIHTAAVLVFPSFASPASI